jgi:hypothetical protein
MAKWSGSEYNGPKENDWEQGEGKFTFPNGVVYHGHMDKGEFHGEGTLIYPNGVSHTYNKLFLTYFYSEGTICCQVGPRKACRRKIFLLRCT